MAPPKAREKSVNGTAIVPVPAVNAAIFNEKGKILLTRRSSRIREPGKWCLPGGHLEIGELWDVAMRREIEEEVGLLVKEEQLCGLYSDPSLTVTLEPVQDGKHVQFVVAVFRVSVFQGEVRPNEEVDAWEWFSSGELPSPMMRSHPVRIHDAFRFKGEVFIR